MHRYQKHRGGDAEKRFLDTISNNGFIQGAAASELFNSCELLYARLYCNGILEDAVTRMRRISHAETRPLKLFAIGVNVGISISLLVLLTLILSIGTASFPELLDGFPVYRAMAMIVLMLWCWGGVTYVFTVCTSLSPFVLCVSLNLAE